MTRAEWKQAYRRLRIVRRESEKTLTDVMLFGAGFARFGPDVPDGIRHVPLNDARPGAGMIRFQVYTPSRFYGRSFTDLLDRPI